MKMALIGGGGVRTVFFCQSLAKYADQLGIDELRIMDIDSEKLHIFGYLASYAIRDLCRTRVVLTESFADAVTDVDYIVTALRVGGDEGRVLDERTALNLGVLGQETTGAGGFAYALRTIPVMVDYMKIIKEKSPRAIVFNFTNPAGLVSQALLKAGFANSIGICDNATGTKINLAESLGVDARRLFVRVYGLNHLTWADSIKLDGVEIIGQLFKNEQFIQNYHDFLYYDRDLIRQLGALPNGYLYYYYHREKALRNILAARQTRGEQIRHLNQKMIQIMREINVAQRPAQALEQYFKVMNERNATYMATELGGQHVVRIPLDVGSLGINALKQEDRPIEVLEGYAGVALNYIDAVRNSRAADLAINVPNHGALDFLQDDDIVEVTCLIDQNGARPVEIGSVPEDRLLLIRQVKRYERLTVDAVREKSTELAIMALLAHPLVGSYSLAKQLMADYKKAHQAYLADWK